MTEKARETTGGALEVGCLGMPMQAVPIHRAPTGAKLGGSGVEASWGWGDVWDVAKKVGGALL